MRDKKFLKLYKHKDSASIDYYYYYSLYKMLIYYTAYISFFYIHSYSDTNNKF